MKKKKKMTKKQLKYFGKTKKSSRKRSKGMSKRKSYRTYARKGISGLSGMIAPIAGGAADKYLNSMLPIKGVGATAIGFILRNPTLKTIGLYEVGASLPSMLGLTSNGGNGGWL